MIATKDNTVYIQHKDGVSETIYTLDGKSLKTVTTNKALIEIIHEANKENPQNGLVLLEAKWIGENDTWDSKKFFKQPKQMIVNTEHVRGYVIYNNKEEGIKDGTVIYYKTGLGNEEKTDLNQLVICVLDSLINPGE